MFKTLTLTFIKGSLFCLFALFLNQTVLAQDTLSEAFAKAPNEVVDTQVIEQRKFYGLAGYYNAARYMKIDIAGRKDIKPDETSILNDDDWLAIVGRFNVLTVQAEGLSFTVEKDGITLNNPEILSHGRVDIVTKHELKSHAAELDAIRYSHLFVLINWLARILETILVFLYSLVGNWGFAIILISVFLKVVMMPLGRLVSRYQQDVSKTQAKLAPRLAEIKAKYKGEEAHKHFMAAHKEAGVTTFYSLKPMIGLFVQIPIWIAIFNVLAEMPQMYDQGFLWIKDLTYPDAIASWGTSLPLLGDTLNVIPLLMTAVTIISTLGFQDKFAPKEILRKQKRNLFFMAAAFLILFYPFPSGMVFYWTLANLLNAIQQIWTQRKNS